MESPQATKLPVGLAITLLRDSDGKINLDIPVTGRIDDPEFSVWRIVLQIVVNLLTKSRHGSLRPAGVPPRRW